MTWLTRAGSHSAGLHSQLFRNLALLHVQLDELRTTLRNRGQAVWLWLALDARTKIIAAVELGPRTQTTAHALIHGLMHVLASGCIPLFTSDGLNLYFYSLTAHFGSWQELPGTHKRVWQVAATLLYGQLIKSYRRRKLARVASVMRWGTLADLGNRLQALGWRGVLQTAFVERVNLTHPARPGDAGPAELGDGADAGAPARWVCLVAGLLSLCETPRVVAS